MRVGTRASKLARLQTQIVVDRLQTQFPRDEIETVLVTTGGDKVTDRPIAEIGVRGVFTKELEDALFRKEVDFVVHSLKDMPTDVPEGLCLAAVLDREDPRDVLVSKNKVSFQSLPPGSVIGTSSRRREAQLAYLRKDLKFIDIRGNLETRVRKLEEGYCDATLLAYAGVHRLGLNSHIAEMFETDVLTPAAGQGALAIECRVEDKSIIERLKTIEDAATRAEIECERAFLSELGGGCAVPIGALARADGETVSIVGCIAALDGSKVFRDNLEGSIREPQAVGKQLAEQMLANGARPVVESLRSSSPKQISPP